VALAATVALWAVSVATAAQAWLGLGSAALLYLLVALQSAAFAVNNPARATIVASLLPRELLPAANALSTLAWTLGMAIGPLLGGVLVATRGYAFAYTVDVVTFLGAVYGVWRLPALPPQGEVRRAGLASVVEGLRFLGTRPNVRMTFLVDLAAMVLAMPRALFPAIGAVVLGGGATTAGLLLSAVSAGSALAGFLSGRLGAVRRQGAAVLVCVVLWGLSIAAFGALVALAPSVAPAPRGGVSWLVWPAAALLAGSGAADAVSAVFRTTILQSATPDALRGRLQGVFLVVVAGGPRLGDLVLGTGGDVVGEGTAALLGGLACAVAVLLLARAQPRFARYDARDPEP
jgi:ENTS family enterobactin (siderophore) exporter